VLKAGPAQVEAAARLRQAAQARPLRLPVNRRVDPSHHHLGEDGIGVWFTIQISSRARIHEAVIEGELRRPTDEECQTWLELLAPGLPLSEVPGLPGALSRRFEHFKPLSAHA